MYKFRFVQYRFNDKFIDKKMKKVIIKRQKSFDLKFRKVGTIFFNNFILINKIFAN